MIEHQNALERAAADTLLEEMPTQTVIDDMATSTAELNESADEVGDISRNVDDLGDAAVSVESYFNDFMENISTESWTPRLAQQYQMGMEAVLRVSGSYVPASVYSASFEAAGVTQTNEENRAETKGKSESVIKSLWASFMKMIEDLWDRLQNFMALLGKSSAAIRKAATNLKSRVSRLGDKPAKENITFSGKVCRYLKSGTSTISDPVEALKIVQGKGFGATGAWYDNYLTAAENTAAHSLGTEDSNSTSLEDELNDLLSPKIKMYDGSWPGVKEIKFTRDAAHPDKFKIALTRETTGEGHVMSSSTLMKLADEMNYIAFGIEHELSRFAKGKGKISAIKTKVSNAIKDGKKPTNPKVLKVIGSLLNGMMEGPRTILPILAQSAMDAYAHADWSIKQHTKIAEGDGGKKAKDGDHEMR